MRKLLKTERLILRKPALEDAARISKLMDDKDIVRMTASIPHPYTHLCAEFWVMLQLANWRRGIGNAYAITQDGSDLMGIMDLFTNCDGDREIGYWIGRPYWGAGYITEAAQTLIAEAFQTSSIDYIDAGYYYDNPASGRVLEKLGFQRKDMGSHIYSIARGEKAAGIELRLPRPATITPDMETQHQRMQKAAR